MKRSEIELQSLELVKDLLQSKGHTAHYSEDIYQPYDLVTLELLYIEVKQRRFNQQQFLTYQKEGFLIEKPKQDFLQSVKGRYMNTFEIDVKGKKVEFILSWNISKKYTFEDKFLPSNTDFNNGFTKNKQITFLPLNDQRIYLKSEDNWIEITAQNLLTLINQ